jgi:hypothetical protein
MRLPAKLCLAALLSAGCGSGSSNSLSGSVSRGSVDLRLNGAAGTNLASSHIPANQVTVAYHDGTGDIVIYVGGWQSEGGGSYSKRWFSAIGLVGEPVEGGVYQLSSAQLYEPGSASMLWQDEPAGSWDASGGTIAVTSVVGPKVGFALDDVTMIPGDGSATGTFSVSGVLTINDINDICDCIESLASTS